MRPLRMLAVLHEPPTPTTGAAIPYHYHLGAFARAGDTVDVAYLRQPGQERPDAAARAQYRHLHEIPLPTLAGATGKALAVTNTLHPANLRGPRVELLSSFNVPALRRKVRELARSGGYDVVLVAATLAWAGAAFDATRVVMAMDGWTDSFRQFHARSRGLERAYWALQVRRMAHTEGRVYADYDVVVVNSDDDAASLHRLNPDLPTLTVPNGVDLDRYRAAPAPSAAPVALFLGDMSYPPNVHAVTLFHERVWPRVLEKVPDARFTIAGRNPAPAVTALAEADASVTVTGAVPDVRPVLHDARVVIAPMVSGGGCKNKVFEALASARPVVVTPLGTRGLDLPVPGVHVEDVDAGMAGTVAALLADADRAHADGVAGRAAAEARLAWAPRSRVLREAIADAVERRHAHASAGGRGTTGRSRRDA